MTQFRFDQIVKIAKEHRDDEVGNLREQLRTIIAAKQST